MSNKTSQILVTGGSGYVGNYMIMTLSKRFPTLKIIGLNRSGKARNPGLMASNYPNVSYVKGNCLHPESFKDVLQDVTGVIHTVGALVDGKGERSYQALNCDTTVNIAREFNQIHADRASQDESAPRGNIVMISSSKAPPFLPKYLSTKIEAENFILNECPHLNRTIIRPGFIWNQEHRSWSVPLSYSVDFLYRLNQF